MNEGPRSEQIIRLDCTLPGQQMAQRRHELQVRAAELTPATTFARLGVQIDHLVKQLRQAVQLEQAQDS